MSAGKASAQAVHAAMMLQDNLSGSFTSSYRRTVVILGADNAQQIKSLSEYLDTAGLFSQYYIDEGENEIAPYSITALAVEPFDIEDEPLREIFAGFSLYGSDDYDDDELDDDTPNAVKRIEYAVGQLRSSLAPKPKRPRWYRRIFRRNLNGYVS